MLEFELVSIFHNFSLIQYSSKSLSKYSNICYVLFGLSHHEFESSLTAYLSIDTVAPF